LQLLAYEHNPNARPKESASRWWCSKEKPNGSICAEKGKAFVVAGFKMLFNKKHFAEAERPELT